MKFTEYLTESKENKNVHLEHLEDEVLNRGVAGARDAINFLRSLRDMLAGHTDTKVNLTTKWDGAPAVFCGINPENNKFFVGTKGVFAKNAKLNYTDKDFVNNITKVFSVSPQLANTKLMQLTFLYELIKKPKKTMDTIMTKITLMAQKKGKEFGPFGKLY